jgi:hypothetical protein
MSGDINVDYLTDNERKKQLDAVLLPYNLTATVHFPTRVQNKSNTTIDNIVALMVLFLTYCYSATGCIPPP